MNQAEISKKLTEAGCKVTPQYVSMIVRGERRLSIKKAKMAGEIMGVDPAVFLLGTIDEVRVALDYNNERGAIGN